MNKPILIEKTKSGKRKNAIKTKPIKKGKKKSTKKKKTMPKKKQEMINDGFLWRYWYLTGEMD
jgi:hypothetical protein